MADGDRYDDGRKYRPYGNRKRQRYQDDEDNYDRPPPTRRRREESNVLKLRRMLLNIAEDPSKLPEDEAKDIARLLGEHFEDEDLKNQFFEVFIQLLIEQPLKIPFVAAIVFYANLHTPGIATEALKRTSERTQEFVDAGQWKEFKLFLRFFACMQSLLQGDGVFTILQQLFDSVVDLQSANENDVIGIELVKIILLTIPYALASGGDGHQEQVNELLEKTKIVAEMRLPMETLVEPYVGDTDDKPFPHYSVIGLLQKQLQNESESGWKLHCIPKFSAPVPRNLDAEAVTPSPQKHLLPKIAISTPINPGSKPLFPEAYFSLYADQDIESVPPTTHIAASLFRDAIVDTIDQLDFNRTEAAKKLIELDCYWQTETFVKRTMPFDKLQEIEQGSTWKPEDIIVDAVFSQIFKLPGPEHKLVYYHSIITEACKAAPSGVAPSLGRAIRYVFRNLDVMDLELSNRFLDWFAHHLSNFEFRWKWAEWLDDLSRSEVDPKKAFIRAALDKEIRLSFAKRIRTTLPKEYHVLIPASLEKERPEFKYDSDQTPFASEGKTLIQQMRKRATDAEIQETIDTIHSKAEELGLPDVMVPSTDAFVTALCCIGAKSLSHAVSYIEKYKGRLTAIAQTSDSLRRQIVASVVEYWKDQPGVAVYILDKLLNYSILTPMTAVQWALSDRMGAGEGLTDNWVYEIIANTVGKVTRSLRNLYTAKFTENLDPEVRDAAEKAFPVEREAMRELFKFIERSVQPVAEGIADKYLEKTGSGELSPEDAALIREWGKRWLTVFNRMALVEEMVVGDAALEAKQRLIAATALPKVEPVAEGNGTVKTEANGDYEML